MQIRDLSDLRPATPPGGVEETIVIPLNGEVYHAVLEPAAETVLGAMGQVGGSAELMSELASLQKTGADMTELAEKNPVMMMRIATVGMTQTERSIAFLQSVLLPESQRRWAHYMKAPPVETPADEGDPARDPATGMRPTTDAEQAYHRARMITLRQCMGVYQELMRAYNGRPTDPPLSSENGHGGTGGTSTAGVPAGALIP